MTPVIYTKPNCPNCDRTKNMFTKNGVAYKTVDITQDEEALARVRRDGFSSAPVVYVGEESWAGFNPAKIRATIDSLKPVEENDDWWV